MAIIDPVAPASPPPATQTGKAPGTFDVGYYGTPPRQPAPPNTSFALPPGSPAWQATAGAYQQSQQARQDALARLLAGMPSQSAFGQNLMQRFLNPQGLDPRALAEMRRMGAEREAGSRGNALMRMEQSANAKGFGSSMGLVDAQARLRAQSAANLNDFDTNLFIQDELRKIANGQSSGQLLAGLLGIDAQLLAQYAQMQSNYAPPIIPGISSPGTQTSGSQTPNPWGSPTNAYGVPIQQTWNGNPIAMGGMVQWA